MVHVRNPLVSFTLNSGVVGQLAWPHFIESCWTPWIIPEVATLNHHLQTYKGSNRLQHNYSSYMRASNWWSTRPILWIPARNSTLGFFLCRTPLGFNFLWSSGQGNFSSHDFATLLRKKNWPNTVVWSTSPLGWKRRWFPRVRKCSKVRPVETRHNRANTKGHIPLGFCSLREMEQF